MKINSFCTCILGILVNRLVYDNVGIKNKILLSQDFDNSGIHTKNKKLKEIFLKEKIDKKFFLKENDIVIKMFEPFHSVVIPKEYEGILVSSNMTIIRTDKVNHHYFNFLLINSHSNLRKFIYQGSTNRFLNIKYLMDLDLYFPSLDKQKQIGKLIQLYEKENYLLYKKIDLINTQKKYYLRRKYE